MDRGRGADAAAVFKNQITARGWRFSAAAAYTAAGAVACAVICSPAAAATPGVWAPLARPAAVSTPRPTVTAPRLVWSDDFTGPAGATPDPKKWQEVRGDWSGGDGELEYYSASRASASLDGAGYLAITARRQPVAAGGRTYPYTSARLQTWGRFATTYGEIEARIKLPEGRGLWPAFWALGTDLYDVGWPDSGEIDMMESLGSDPFTLYGTLHGPQVGVPDGFAISAAKRSATSLTAGFHTYGVIWSPAQIRFTLDGVTYGSFTPASLDGGTWVFNRPFYLLLNLAVGGEWPGSPSSTTVFPATMLVDWVRVYSL